MKLDLGKWKVLVACVAVAAIALLAGQLANASNMGFKMNKQIVGPAGAGLKGTNLVGVPFKSPYNNAQDLCAALGLTGGVGAITQIDASTGNPLGHTCGGGGPFVLRVREGFIATNNVNTSGILVGAHTPGATVTIFGPTGAGLKGTNLYDIPYHTTSANAQDVCNDLGLTASVGTVTRIDPAGNPSGHTCGGGGPFGVVLGEALIVTNNVNRTVSPSHF